MFLVSLILLILALCPWVGPALKASQASIVLVEAIAVFPGPDRMPPSFVRSVMPLATGTLFNPSMSSPNCRESLWQSCEPTYPRMLAHSRCLLQAGFLPYRGVESNCLCAHGDSALISVNTDGHVVPSLRCSVPRHVHFLILQLAFLWLCPTQISYKSFSAFFTSNEAAGLVVSTSKGCSGSWMEFSSEVAKGPHHLSVPLGARLGATCFYLG